VHLAIIGAVVVVAAAGYWWLTQPPGRYKPDNSGLYPITVNGKVGFMDRSGKTVIAPQFDGTLGFSEGLASVEIGTKWGYINTKGVVAITPQFDEAFEFRFGRAAVKLGNRAGFIDKDGKYISSPGFLWVGMFNGDLAPAMTTDRVVAFVNHAGKLEMSGRFQSISGFGFADGLAPAQSGGKWGCIDTTGNWVIDPQFEEATNFSDGLAQVKVGGRWGYIDQKGKFVVNPQYDFGGDFHGGYAFFGSGGKFGFIDTKGRVVVEAKFLNAGNFSDGLAPVQTEEGWGFLDRTGKMVVSPQFDTAEVFQNGLARVTALGKEAYITTTGAFVVNPFPGTNLGAERARLAAEAAHTIVDTYLGRIGDKDFKLFIEKVEGDSVEGYDVSGTNRRPVKGRIVNKSTKPTGLGGNFTIFKLILAEPGDDIWDGEFNIDLWISDIGRHGEGSWKSFNGKLEHPITIKDPRN
jgi:hypothetical protein